MDRFNHIGAEVWLTDIEGAEVVLVEICTFLGFTEFFSLDDGGGFSATRAILMQRNGDVIICGVERIRFHLCQRKMGGKDET